MKEILLLAGLALIVAIALGQIYLRSRQKAALAHIEPRDADGIYLFASPTCAICMQMKRIYADRIREASIKVIDITEQSDLARQYGILSVPTTIVIHQGKAAKTFLGFVKPAELVMWLPHDEGDTNHDDQSSNMGKGSTHRGGRQRAGHGLFCQWTARLRFAPAHGGGRCTRHYRPGGLLPRLAPAGHLHEAQGRRTVSMEHDMSMDLRGLCCAEPIIRVTKALKTLQPGQTLLISADKVSMLKDIAAYCNQTGNPLLQQTEQNGIYQFWIQRSG